MSEIVVFNLHKLLKTFANNPLKLFRNTIKNKPAFTLAETLITIGMIGVIATLTLPTLMNSTNDKEIVARVKKTYSVLNEAYGRAVAKYGNFDTWCTNLPLGVDCKTRNGKRLTEFLQVDKDCGTSTGCFLNKDPKYIDGTTDSESSAYNLESDSTNYYKVKLSDATSLGIGTNHIIVDIDGANKGNNIIGKDLFQFYIDNNRVYAVSLGNATLTSGSDIMYYAQWILNQDNADYLYINSSGKCPDGKQLNDSNPTCN